MILSSAGVAAGSIPTQNNLFNTIVANNPGNFTNPPASYSTNGNYYSNPTGLRAAVAAADGAHSYVAYNISNVNTANRILAYDIDNYKVAAGALVQQGNHWVTVVGINTNVKPTAGGNFTVNGFYVRDPWTGTTFATNAGVPGMGYNAYLATTGADAKWKNNFLPTKWGGTWQGNYAFVADPDPGEDGTDPVFPSDPAPLGSELTGSGAVTAAGNDLPGVAGLAGDGSFESGGFTTSGEMEVMHGGQLAEDEWLVPYDNPSGESGVALIDAVTGELDAAYWNEGGTLDPAFINGLLQEDTTPPGTFINGIQQTDGSEVPVDNVTPEPATLVLMSLGGIALALAHRQRRAKAAANSFVA